jgi:uncharacterized membrane protein (Fun14 family)
MRKRPAATSLAFFGIGLVLFIGGVAGIIAGHGVKSWAGIGVVFIGLALMVWLLGWLSSMNVTSGSDREREEAARDYFTQHGHWPGEG